MGDCDLCDYVGHYLVTATQGTNSAQIKGAVWRRLHVEKDSMAQVLNDPNDTTDPNPEDDFTLLPKFPDLGLMAQLFQPAYLKVVEDGGGNNTQNLPSRVNIEPFTSDEIRTQVNQGLNGGVNRKDSYWICYLQSAFQGLLAGDGDPNAEFNAGTALGATPQPEGSGSLIFLEVIRDNISFLVSSGSLPAGQEAQKKIDLERVTVVHEVGHQFQFGHPAEEAGVTGSIMDPAVVSAYILGTGPLPLFNAYCLNRIRNRSKSPGVLP